MAPAELITSNEIEVHFLRGKGDRRRKKSAKEAAAGKKLPDCRAPPPLPPLAHRRAAAVRVNELASAERLRRTSRFTTAEPAG